VKEISASDLAALGAAVTILDVREQDEYDRAHLSRSTLIPMSEFISRIADVPHDETLYILCASGVRSAQVAQYLGEHGYDAVNVTGGITAWQASGQPVERG
jgi:rhodanese-related sulfurtransferase